MDRWFVRAPRPKNSSLRLDHELIRVFDRRREIVVGGRLLDPDFDMGPGQVVVGVGDVAERDQLRALVGIASLRLLYVCCIPTRTLFGIESAKYSS
jgi:hypothetical protein